MAKLSNRIMHAWNAFQARDETYVYESPGGISYNNPSRPRVSFGNEQSILTAVYNRIAMDVASIDFHHIRTDSDGRYIETIDDSLHQCLTVSANVDQTGRGLIQDIVLSMFDEGSVAIVPVETSVSPITSGGYNIHSLRVGKIVAWKPDKVQISLYDDRTGRRDNIWMPKNIVAIIENPLYAVMNEPNSTVKRLTRKLNLLDAIDEQSGSGKLDLIIQLPYVIKSEARQKQAEERRQAIEHQLSGSKYGIAYTDGTEHITQLNRPTENNLMTQITYLTNMVYSQIGVSERVFNGTAEEKEMLNYFARTVNPIATAIIESMRRIFLTKTARTQGHTIMGYRDMFRLISAIEMAKISDSFTRNEITSSNEIRSIIGMKPSDDPRADELRNRNMPSEEPSTKKQKEVVEED